MQICISLILMATICVSRHLYFTYTGASGTQTASSGLEMCPNSSYLFLLGTLLLSLLYSLSQALNREFYSSVIPKLLSNKDQSISSVSFLSISCRYTRNCIVFVIQYLLNATKDVLIFIMSLCRPIVTYSNILPVPVSTTVYVMCPI